jgi:ribosomal protein S18 acetylase RimI-like enzyme
MAELSGEGSTLTILHLNEEKRNQGLGNLLMRNLLLKIHQKGGKTMHSEIVSWNLSALALYISFGLKPLAHLMAIYAKI